MKLAGTHHLATLVLPTLAIALFIGCGGGSQSGSSSPNAASIVYVAHDKSNNVVSFRLDEQRGTFTRLATAPAGNGTGFLAVSPDHRWLYASNTLEATISKFALDGNGGMRQIGSPTVLSNPSGNAVGLRVAPSGKFLYVASTANAIEAFSIDGQNGELQPLPDSPFPAPSAIDLITLTASGQFLYASGDRSDAIYAFAVDTVSGGLTAVPGGTLHTGADPMRLAVDPTDHYLFATTYYAKKVLIYRIEASGALQALVASAPVNDTGSFGISFTKEGDFVFVPVMMANEIASFAFDPASATLSQVPSSPVHDGQIPSDVWVSSNGKFLVVIRIEMNPGSICVYQIDPQTGALSFKKDSVVKTDDMPVSLLLVSTN